MAEQAIRVLVVDDEELHAQTVAEILDDAGYACTLAANGRKAVALIERDPFEVVITDLKLGDLDGMAVLAKVRERLPDAETIVVTGHGTIKTAVEAMQQGASTYLTKPLDLYELRTVVGKVAERWRLRQANAELRRQLHEKFGFEGVIGNSTAMHKVIASLKSVAPTSATVLILGENGTGKELVARAIHLNSPRAGKPFVAINCAALNENLIESELFGHEKGAYTTADRQRKGRFEVANGGTLFLDEVGDLPTSTQIKLLRVLEGREITRVGSNDPIRIDVRLVSATNRDIEQMVKDGAFRQDLYYRLKVFAVRLPPLRERRADILLLADHFLKEFTQIHGKPMPTMSNAAGRVLQGLEWPGNVRELRNTLETMFILDQDGRLDLDDMPPDLAGAAPPPAPIDAPADSLVGKPLSTVEAFYIEQALRLSGGNREQAAAMLDISERTMYRKIKEYDIPDVRRADA